MQNLLQDTLKVLAKHGHSEKDVLWVGTKFVWFTWDEFKKLAQDTEVDPFTTIQDVAANLMVVGEGWWLERFRTDSYEGWEHITYPVKPETYLVPKVLTVKQANALKEGADRIGNPDFIGWTTLELLNWEAVDAEKDIFGR